MSDILKEQCINVVIENMENKLDDFQLSELRKALEETFSYVDMTLMSNPLSAKIMNNESILKEFIIDKAYSGCSVKTISRYGFVMSKFFQIIPIPYDRVKSEHIKQYLLFREKSVSKRTVDGERHCISSFFTWLFDQEYIPKNIMRLIGKIKVPETQKKHLTDLEVISIVDACKNNRDKALIELCLSTGVRISEICIIKKCDINFAENSILIHGKGNKERTVYMNARCQKRILEYLSNSDGSREYDSEYLFSILFKDKGIIRTKPLCSRTIMKILSEICDKAGIENVTMHTFRRYFANNLINKGCSLEIVANLLGHSSPDTTLKYYINKKNLHAKDAVMRFSL